MRKQWPCSKCGYACASTWRSPNTSRPIICNRCRSKGAKEDPNPPKNEDDVSRYSCFDDQISPSNSNMHENVGGIQVSITQIGMIFGNIPFEPTLAIPIILGPGKSQETKVGGHGKSQEVKIKTEEYTGDEDWTTEFQHPFFTYGNTNIRIKQEQDCEDALSDPRNDSIIWDTDKVHKRKRSKLPQYTQSPLARFINQLQQVSCYGRRPYNIDEGPKYDDVFIYEKCKLVAENEIGLGAKKLSPLIFLAKPTVVIKEEPYY